MEIMKSNYENSVFEVETAETYLSEGETLDHRPEVRKIGEQVCRFVRPIYIDKLPKRKSKGLFINAELSEKYYVPIDEQPIEFTQGPVLEAFAEQLTSELIELQDFGVPVNLPKIEVGKVPEYNRKEEVIGYISGLKIVSDFVEGTKLSEFEPFNDEEVNDVIMHTEFLYDAIKEYIAKKHKNEEAFLGAIITPKNYIFGTVEKDKTPDTWLIKPSPIFMSPTQKHFRYAMNETFQAKNSVIERIIDEYCADCDEPSEKEILSALDNIDEIEERERIETLID